MSFSDNRVKQLFWPFTILQSPNQQHFNVKTRPIIINQPTHKELKRAKAAYLYGSHISFQRVLRKFEDFHEISLFGIGETSRFRVERRYRRIGATLCIFFNVIRKRVGGMTI